MKGGWQNLHLGMEGWVKDGQETQRGLLVNHLTDYAISSWWIIVKSTEGTLRYIIKQWQGSHLDCEKCDKNLDVKSSIEK